MKECLYDRYPDSTCAFYKSLHASLHFHRGEPRRRHKFVEHTRIWIAIIPYTLTRRRCKSLLPRPQWLGSISDGGAPRSGKFRWQEPAGRRRRDPQTWIRRSIRNFGGGDDRHFRLELIELFNTFESKMIYSNSLLPQFSPLICSSALIAHDLLWSLMLQLKRSQHG